MTNVQRIHEQHKLNAKPTYHIIHGYDNKKKEWKFTGYRCNSCEQTLRTEYVATKHVCNPSKARKFKNDDFLTEAKIKDNMGKIWKPFTTTNL